MRRYSVILLVLLLSAACVPGLSSSRRSGTAWGTGAFGSNGERIYFTSTNEEGRRIGYVGGPPIGGMMMGGILSCASCHGPDARGGLHTMHMDIMDAPDIRWSALEEEEEAEHSAAEDDGEDDEHTGYDFGAFKLAVVEGRHPDGDPLEDDMPRWRISDDDLRDLAEFLKVLPQ